MSLNVTIVGNATADSELRITQAGKPLATFTVAVNERIKNDDGTWGDGEPAFYRVTAWGSLAESVVENVNKGTGVIIVGRFKPRKYEDKEGAERTSLDVTADNIGITLKRQPTQEQPQHQTATADEYEAMPF